MGVVREWGEGVFGGSERGIGEGGKEGGGECVEVGIENGIDGV